MGIAKSRILALLVVAVMIPLISGCFTIVSINQPAGATAGDQIQITVEVQTDGTDANPHYGIFALLIPNDWAVDAVNYSGDYGPNSGVFLPADVADGDPGGQVDYWETALEANTPSGAGMKWVVYQTAESYVASLDPAYVDVVVDLTVGQRNGDYNIGYFVTDAALDFTDPTYYAINTENPFQVTGGTDQVYVTFLANTATVPDTLGPNSVVQIRGGGGPLTWGGDSPVVLENIGGDYWIGSAPFTPGEDIQFKFYTNAEHSTVAAGDAWEHQGWEGDVAGGNRVLAVPDHDTTLALEFVNGWLSGVEQYGKPYPEIEGTTAVWVRVNVEGWADFNPAYQIGIRGSNNVDWTATGEISWGETYLLNRESNHVNGGSQRYSGGNFYSNVVHVPDAYIGGGLQFKVVVHQAGAALNEDWGNMVVNSGREDVIAISGNDTTQHWFWFNNLAPIPVSHEDEVIVTFNADMANAITNRGFAYGDTLLVRSGYFGTALNVRTKTMLRQGLSSVYSAIDTIVSTIGEKLDYQYYLVKNGVEYREVYYNFYYDGETTGEAERRVYSPIEGGVITVSDMDEAETGLHRMPVFRNTEEIAQDVVVTFTCDVRPAIYQVAAGVTLDDIQGNIDISDPAQVLALGLAINGPATGTWATWGSTLMVDPLRRMFDDGTNGDDVAGDSIYTIVISFYKDSLNNVIGQEFKFGIGGGDNEGGVGGYGNNHIANIDDSQPTYTIASQFGSINPAFYDAWDFDNQGPATAVEDRGVIPQTYAMEPNFPNPFNPKTTIRYQIPVSEKVILDVYDLMGHKVVSLVDQNQAAGSYTVTWDGKDSFGQPVGSGVYIYHIEAGQFSQTQKMVYIK